MASLACLGVKWGGGKLGERCAVVVDWWSGGGESDHGERKGVAGKEKKKAARESEREGGRQSALESQVRCPLGIPLGLFGTLGWVLACCIAYMHVDNQV